MDHVRISGNEPRQWSLAKQSSFKVENGVWRFSIYVLYIHSKQR